MLPVQLEQAIAELVARGLVTSDAFSPLRWLIRPESEKRRKQKAWHGAEVCQTGLLGRWSISGGRFPESGDEAARELFPDQVRLASLCEALLRRYGVVFRAVLERESLLPPWRYLLRYLRRWRTAVKFTGGVLSMAFPASSLPCPKPWVSCGGIQEPDSSAQGH